MRKLLSLAVTLALAGLALLPSGVQAAEPVVLDQRLEAPGRLTVGDRFRLVVVLEADRGTVIGFAPASLPPQLALASRPETSSRTRGGRVEVTIRLELAAFVPGQLSVPPLRFVYGGPDGPAGEVSGRPFQLNVESVLAASGDPTPRDLKPQLEIPVEGATPVWQIAGAALLLVALSAGLVAWRMRAARKPVAEPVPVPVAADQGPEDRARGELDRAGAAFAAGQDYVAYYSTIAVTVRTYLTERFGFPAFALTTRELQDQMVRHGMDRWQARLVSGLLSQCDAVVFAHYRPALERADADLTAAYEIVELARPQARQPEMAGVT